MNFEEIGKLMDSKTKELAGQASELESDTRKAFGKEREWILIFSIIAIAAAFLPFIKITSFFTESISLSIFDMVSQDLWNLLFWIPQIIILVLVAKKVRYADIVIPIITGLEFWLYVAYALDMCKDSVDEYGMVSMGIGFWLIIVSLFGINWMADKLNMGIISFITRLLKKIVQPILQSDNQQANVHPITNEDKAKSESVVCSECGITLSNDAKFCPGCGSEVVMKGKNKCCSNCGSEYREGAAFCGHCGEKINEKRKRRGNIYMYCEKCGTEMKATDTFCEKCGNKNLKSAKIKEMNVSKMKKYGVIAAVVVLILVSFTVISKQVKKNSYIKAVQTMAPKRYPSVTFKEAFSQDMVKSSKWEYVSEDGYDFVMVTADLLNIDDDGGSLIVCFSVDDINNMMTTNCGFIFNKNNKYFTKDAFGEEVSESAYGLIMIDLLFGNVYEEKNYTLPNMDVDRLVHDWTLESFVSMSIIEYFSPVEYVKATPDMINKSVPASATVAVETEPATTPVIVETTPEETKQLITYNTDSKDFELNWPEETVQSPIDTIVSTPAPQIYETHIDPDDVINAVFVGDKSDSVSMFYITKDGDGYRLYVEAANLNGRGAEKFSGYATEIGTIDGFGLVFVFTSDHEDDWEYVGNDNITVGWRDYESIDHPALIGNDPNVDYIFNGYYHFEENLAQ